jgi:hypothetical protein
VNWRIFFNARVLYDGIMDRSSSDHMVIVETVLHTVDFVEEDRLSSGF